MDKDPTLYHGGRLWRRPHFARWGPSSHPQNWTQPPVFSPCLLWTNSLMDQDATWYHGGTLWPRPHCARWGPSSPPPKNGHSPHFCAHVYCGQTAGWIRMPLGMKAGLGPGHIVSHGDPAPPKEAQPPIFGLCLLWPNGRPSQLLLSCCK